MIDSGYPYSTTFQRCLLALLIKNPSRLTGIIKPEFFGNPMHVDIARVLMETHAKHPNSRLQESTLRELVKESLGRTGREHWSTYKHEIKRIYGMQISDEAILLRSAREFAKETTHRDALVRAERSLTNGHYEKVYEIFDELRRKSAADGTSSPRWKDLPKYSDFEFEKVEWLIDGLLPKGAIVALSGEEGVGKTLFALAMACSLTEGNPFLGRNVLWSRVLYLGLDISKPTLQIYIRAMNWDPDGDFRLMTMWTGTGPDREAPMMDDPQAMTRLLSLAERYQPVIIVDTLRDFFEGEENSSTDTKPVLDFLRKLRSCGATLVLIVHPPKSGGSIIRGTGNISQKVDIPYLMTKETWQGKDIIVLTCPKKNRFGSTHFRMATWPVFVPTPPGLRVFFKELPEWKPTSESKHREDDSRVLEYVKGNPGCNQKEIEVSLKMGGRSVQKALWTAKKAGLLRCSRGRGNEIRWFPVDEKAGTLKPS